MTWQSQLAREWVSIVGMLALAWITITAFGVMLGIVRTGDAAKRMATLAYVVVLLLTLPSILINRWSALSLWQRIGLVLLGVIAFSIVHKPRRKAPHETRK